MFQIQVVSQSYIENVTVVGGSDSKIPNTTRVEEDEGDIVEVNENKDIKGSKTVVTDEKSEYNPDIQKELVLVLLVLPLSIQDKFTCSKILGTFVSNSGCE